MIQDDDPVLSPAEAAKRLGVSSATLRVWAEAGKIRATHTLGGHRRYPTSEVERVLDAHVRPQHPENGHRAG